MKKRRRKQTIVDQLRAAVVDSGESQYAIAAASGVSQGVVSRFVRAERGITLDVAAKLADHLGLELRPR